MWIRGALPWIGRGIGRAGLVWTPFAIVLFWASMPLFYGKVIEWTKPFGGNG